MKKLIAILALSLVALASRAIVTNLTVSAYVNTVIPDNTTLGLYSQATVAGMTGPLTNFSVSLNITGGVNSDLYAYLLSPENYTVVLLNRVGVSSSVPLGYTDAGFNITLSPSASYNIHGYQANGPSFSGGQLIGDWAPDQRAIDPQSSVGAFDAAPAGNGFDSFFGPEPNGVWTLFVADFSTPGQSTLESWSMTLTTVPEPQAWTLLIVGGGMLVGFRLYRGKNRCTAGK